MADSDSVVCSKCKVGFAPGTEACPICKIPLVSEDEFEDEPGEIPEPIILDDVSDMPNSPLQTRATQPLRNRLPF